MKRRGADSAADDDWLAWLGAPEGPDDVRASDPPPFSSTGGVPPHPSGPNDIPWAGRPWDSAPQDLQGMSWPEDLPPLVDPIGPRAPAPPAAPQPRSGRPDLYPPDHYPADDHPRLRRQDMLWPDDPGPGHTGHTGHTGRSRPITGPHDLLSADEILRRSGEHDLHQPGRHDPYGMDDLRPTGPDLRHSARHDSFGLEDLRPLEPEDVEWAEAQGLTDPSMVDMPIRAPVEVPLPPAEKPPLLASAPLPWVDQVMGDAAAAAATRQRRQRPSSHDQATHHGAQAFGLTGRHAPQSDLYDSHEGLQTEFAPVHTGWAKFGWVLRDLGVVVGLVLMVVGAWAVLVQLRMADSRPASAGTLAGSLDFSVASTMRADRVASVGTWVATVTTMLVLGAVIFSSFVATTASRAIDRSTVRLVRLAAVVGAAASLSIIPFRAAAVTGLGRAAMTDVESLQFVASSRFGSAALLRAAGLLLATFAVPGPEARSRRSQRAERRARPVEGSVVDHLLGGAGAALILGSYAWVGHPQATEGPGPALVLAQSVHIVAVATWFGGLVLLYLQIRTGRRAGAVQTSAEVVERFSTAAGLAVALVGATGMVLARSQIASIDALTDTPYGRALAVKLGLVALVVAIGGANKIFVVPRIKRHEGPKAWRSLHRTLLCEAAVIAGGVLLATSAMVSGGI